MYLRLRESDLAKFHFRELEGYFRKLGHQVKGDDIFGTKEFFQMLLSLIQLSLYVKQKYSLRLIIFDQFLLYTMLRYD